MRVPHIKTLPISMPKAARFCYSHGFASTLRCLLFISLISVGITVVPPPTIFVLECFTLRDILCLDDSGNRTMQTVLRESK